MVFGVARGPHMVGGDPIPPLSRLSCAEPSSIKG
jgi:hypothetical protein